MGLGREHLFGQGGRVRAHRAGPGDQAGRRPFQVGAVAGRHVGRVGYVTAPAVLSGVARHPAASPVHLDGAGCGPQLELLVHEGVGDRVIMPAGNVTVLDVVIDIDGDFFPLGQFVTLGGQRL